MTATDYILIGVPTLVFSYFLFNFLRGMYYAYKIYKKTGRTDLTSKIKTPDPNKVFKK